MIKIASAIDLFSLYVLFSHFRPRDATRGNSFFQMSTYARANVRITNEKNKRQIPMRSSRGLKWEIKMYKLKMSLRKPSFQTKGRFSFKENSVLHRSVIEALKKLQSKELIKVKVPL